MVHLNDGVTLLGIGLRSRILHVADCVFLRDDLRDGEECGLENRIDSGAKADLLADLEAVDRVEVDIVISNVFLNLARELLSSSSGVHWQFSRKLPPFFSLRPSS